MLMRITALVAAAAYLSGCASLVALEGPPQNAGSVLTQGDRAVLATRDGRVHDFTVTRSAPEEVCGKDECVRTSEITGAQRQEPKPAVVVATVVVGIALAVGFVAYALSHVSVPATAFAFH